IALAVLVVVRMFVRYFPVPIGKRWVYDTVIDRHLAWRPFGTTARMRAGPRLHVQLPDQIQSRVYFFGTWEPEISDYISRALSPATNRGATTTVPSVARRKHQALEAEVEADTLSSIVGVERLLTARLIKIDVEGAECSVLHGIAHLLSKFSPATEWLIEISPD